MWANHGPVVCLHCSRWPTLSPKRVSRALTVTTGSSPAPMLGESPSSKDTYPISQTLNPANPGPVSWAAAAAGRPTLTGGLTAGRIAGELTRRGSWTRRPHGVSLYASVRRSIQDLVLSIDRNVKVDPEVEDLLLDIADEFIDSVTNFCCRLARHRGGKILEVRDLQPPPRPGQLVLYALPTERDHNICIPSFASDLTPIALSQTGTQGTKKGVQGAQNSHHAHRLAQVAQAKLM
ncbi:transcription initiation factor TFIID subunit A-domain-containing protein [Lactarius hengduanensis]|nr:transcription initiation factor TFIID subunit A-domain-containing protein [Lactarius hengduanensis]